MAQIIKYWPEVRERPTKQMSYPWEDWTNGDIWLAEAGIDFPLHSNVWHFRQALYQRSRAMTNQRKKRIAKLKPQARRFASPPEPIHVTVRIVSDTQVAFQFFEGEDPPPEPEVIRTSIPRTTPSHRAASNAKLAAKKKVAR